MSARRHALITVALLALSGVPLTPSAAAPPPVDPGALAHCASMTAADERLACYDSLSRPKTSAGPATATTPATKTTPRQAATPPAKPAAAASDAAAPGAAATAAGATAAATGAGAAAGGAADAKSFGLMPHPPPTEEGPSHIQAKVTKVDTDRLGNVHVSLDNGQAWTFVAPDALLRVGEAVTIKRGTVGSFLLTTASHHTYRVQRTE